MVWYGISFLPLFWTTFLGRMAHALIATYIAKCLSLVPGAHRAIGNNTEILFLSRSRTSERGKNCIRKILHLEAAALLTLPFFFFLIYGWRKWCKYFFIPSSWTGKTTEWLCKPLNYETKYSWQQKVLRSCSLAPLSLTFCIRTAWSGVDWADATVFQCSDPEGLGILVLTFQENNSCAW